MKKNSRINKIEFMIKKIERKKYYFWNYIYMYLPSFEQNNVNPRISATTSGGLFTCLSSIHLGSSDPYHKQCDCGICKVYTCHITMITNNVLFVPEKYL